MSEDRPGWHDRVLAYLAEHSPADMTQISRALGITRYRAQLVLRAAERDGDVCREPYSATEPYPWQWSVQVQAVPEHLDTGRLARLLRDIYATASEPYTATGKFAYITALADDALDMLGARGRRIAEVTGLSREVAGLASGTGMPSWIAIQIAALRPVSQGDWYEPDGTRWHAEANRVNLIVIRTSQYDIAYPHGQQQGTA